MFSLKEHPHRRFNPLTGEWMLVSPHRTSRPWQGQIEKPSQPTLVQYDPECYLCPGNSRAGGVRNPHYDATFVFENDFAALRLDTPIEPINEGDLVIAQGEPGLCRVLCFSPRHDLTLALMSPQEVRTVIDLWAEQFAEMGAMPNINHVQIFENRGEMMGASNPHPHGQIWGNATLPNEPLKEQLSQKSYRSHKDSCLLCDYLALELRLRERVVFENDHFAVVVPFWATWPFETLLLSRRHVSDITQLETPERNALAVTMKQLVTRYDNLFEISFPYSMGFHQQPTDGEQHPEWHLHAHFYPPLLRSATVRKFMVGYEMLGSPQRDITPEAAAERIRELPDTHYSERNPQPLAS